MILWIVRYYIVNFYKYLYMVLNLGSIPYYLYVKNLANQKMIDAVLGSRAQHLQSEA